MSVKARFAIDMAALGLNRFDQNLHAGAARNTGLAKRGQLIVGLARRSLCPS